jgi:RimJ/RimL family protein N-acetyltransferase
VSLGWTPVQVPAREALEGKTVRLLPVDPARHAAPLYAAVQGADSIWDYLAYGPFESLASFTAWLEARAASADPLFFTVVDVAVKAPRGMVSYMRMDPANGVIEIGNIWFAPALQRTRQATEAIYLLARHVFEDLGYRRLEWKCDSRNAPSRRAAERFGFVYEGVFRQHMVIKDRNRDTAWFGMTDGDWPHCKEAFETWLGDANFDAAGRQRRSLAEVRASRSD